MLHTTHIVITVLTTAAAGLLAYLLYVSAGHNPNLFTRAFLKLLSVGALVKGAEVLSASYRSGRIKSASVPMDAAIVGLLGRGLELIVCVVIIWFLLKPETKRALNGGNAMGVRSGALPPDYWRKEFRQAVRDVLDERGGAAP